MGYRIEYDNGDNKTERRKILTVRCLWMSVCVFALFTAGVCRYWEEGWDVLKSILFPGNWTTARIAAEDFVRSVRSGSDFSEAVMGFCAEIISNG